VCTQCLSDPVTTMHSLNTMQEHFGKVPSGNFIRARIHTAYVPKAAASVARSGQTTREIRSQVIYRFQPD
jgi:hypothetical protein